MLKLLLTFALFSAVSSAQVSTAFNAYLRYNDKGTFNIVGDTFRCSPKISGLYYCSFNDGGGAQYGGAGGRSVGFISVSLDLTNVNNTVLTFINSTSDYGGVGQRAVGGWGNSFVFKSGGFSYNPATGLLYWNIAVNCWDQVDAACTALPTFSPTWSTFLVSDDLGQHWNNPDTIANNGGVCCVHNTTTANGDVPTFATKATSMMWDGTNKMANIQFVGFQTGDTTDGAGTYAYGLSSQSDTLQYYLARVPKNQVNVLSAWQYYTGPLGGDVNNTANWCSTSYAACEGSMTGLSDGYDIAPANIQNNTMGQMVHLPAPWNCYLMVTNFVDATPAGAGSYHLKLLSSPTMIGPWRQLEIDTVNKSQTFPQILLDTLQITDPAQGIGKISTISSGIFSNPNFDDYSPYWTTYTMGPAAPVYGPHNTGNGLQLQGYSNVRYTSGSMANALPKNGLVQVWGFDDNIIYGSQTPWPYLRSTEQFTNQPCSASVFLNIISGGGVQLTGGGEDTANGAHCGTRPNNAPSFLTGDPSFSLFTVYQPGNLNEGVFWYFGGGTTAYDAMYLAQSRVNSGDLCLMGYPFNAMACTNGGQFTAGNWYMFGFTRQGGSAPSAANTSVYLGKTPLTWTSFGGVAPSITAGPLIWGAKSDASNTAYQKVMTGTYRFGVLYNRKLTFGETQRVYSVLKWRLGQLGIPIQ